MHDCTPTNSASTIERLSAFLGLLLLGLILPALLLDAPLARWIADIRGDSSSVVVLVPFELAARALGALVVLLVIAIADFERRREVLRVAVSVLSAGLLTLFLKYVVARERPFLLQPDEDIWQSFQGLFATFRGNSFELVGDRMRHSFPSGHVTTAFALALGLAWLYPRARWWLLAAAALVAVQRITHLEHFLSDTLAGAAVGLLAGRWILLHGAWGDVGRPDLPSQPEPE